MSEKFTLTHTFGDLDAPIKVPNYVPRKGNFAIPDSGIFDEPLICFKVNSKWVGHIIGALEILDQADAWSGSETEIEDARAEIRKLMAMVESCDDMITDIRINNCIIEAFIGGEWVAKADITNCVDSRIEGTVNDEIRDTAWDEPNSGELPDPVDDLDCLWGGCLNLVTYVFSVSSNVADILDAATDAVDAVGDFLVAFPAFNRIAFTTALASFEGALTITTALLRQSLAQESKERLACLLFCRIRSANNGNTLTTEIYDLWCDDVLALAYLDPPTLWSTGLGVVSDIARNIAGRHYGFKQFQIGLNNCEDDWMLLCDDCEEFAWCYTFDFTEGQQGWSSEPLDADWGATYSAGVGWKPIDNISMSRYNRAACISIDLAGVTHLTAITVVFDLTKSTYQDTGLNLYTLEERTPRNILQGIPAVSVSSGTNKTHTWEGDLTTDRKIAITVRPYRSTSLPSGDCTIKSVTFHGLGENPFGEDNC